MRLAGLGGHCVSVSLCVSDHVCLHDVSVSLCD